MKNKKEEEEEGRRKIKDRFEGVYIFVTRADWYSRMQCSLYLFKHFPAKMIEFTYLETSLLNNSGRCSISISTLTRANIRYTWGEVSWQALSRAPCTIATKITGVDFFFFFSSRLSSSYRPRSPPPFTIPSSVGGATAARWKNGFATKNFNTTWILRPTLADIPETERVRANSTTDWKALFAIKRKPTDELRSTVIR